MSLPMSHMRWVGRVTTCGDKGFNLPPLVLKARHLSGPAVCVLIYSLYIGVPEQALGWLLLGLGLVVEDEPSELSYTLSLIHI